MTDHLSTTTLNALADGELSEEQILGVNQHLAGCSGCTTSALVQSLLKSATARAGHRYTPPPDLRGRMARLAAEGAALPQSARHNRGQRPARAYSSWGWAVAVALLLICVSLIIVDRNARRTSAESAGLVAEVSDQHIATLAANSPPEVISSDRHTVKPWFQGKIPFSFNLPQDLPADTTLDGANLTFLRNRPTAQLLYSIGKHRISVFVQQRDRTVSQNILSSDFSGFHLTGFFTDDLEVIAISDVDSGRLADLVDRIKQAQAKPRALSD